MIRMFQLSGFGATETDYIESNEKITVTKDGVWKVESQFESGHHSSTIFNLKKGDVIEAKTLKGPRHVVTVNGNIESQMFGKVTATSESEIVRREDYWWDEVRIGPHEEPDHEFLDELKKL